MASLFETLYGANGQVNPVNAPGGNVFNLAGGALNTAGAAYGNTVQPGAIRSSMNSYMSPYISRVIDDSVSRLRDRKGIDLNMIKGNAAQSGAFGGSRHGLIEAETIDNYGRSEDELVARLLQQGFDTSAGLATQEIGFQQSGAAGLAGLGSTAFGMGQQANQGQLQSGTTQQQMLQAILSGASGQYQDFTNAPTNALGGILSAISGNPLSGNVSKSYKPGLFDYLSMATGTYAAGK